MRRDRFVRGSVVTTKKLLSGPYLASGSFFYISVFLDSRTHASKKKKDGLGLNRLKLPGVSLFLALPYYGIRYSIYMWGLAVIPGFYF